MPEVLRLPMSEDGPRVLVGPQPILDPATAAVFDRAITEATERAYLDGAAAGRAAAVDEARAATARLGDALARVLAELDAQRVEATRASLELAHRAAALVLDRTPPDDATQVLDRLREALAVLDEEPLQVHVHPDDAPALRSAGERRVEVVEDLGIAPGELQLRGRTCGADLTRAALLDAALEVLGEGAA